MTNTFKAYFSNVSPLWPIAKQRELMPKDLVAEYLDDLESSERRTKNPKLLSERAYMLRPTTRRNGAIILVADWPVLAWNAADLVSVFKKASAQGITIRAIITGNEVPPKATTKEIGAAVEAFQTAITNKIEVGRAGGSISAANRIAEAKTKTEKIRADWSNPTYKTEDLLGRVGLVYNTAKKYLGSRERAIAMWQANHKRAIKSAEVDKKPKQKVDFCGLYVFQIDDDVFKIGTSRNSQTRLKQVSAYHKKRMKVVALFNMEIEKATALEAEVHYRLRKYQHPEYNGREIFKTSLIAINRTVKRATKYLFEVPNE